MTEFGLSTGLTVTSLVVGILLLVASSIGLSQVAKGAENCWSAGRPTSSDDLCLQLYGYVGGTSIGIIAGTIQIIVSIVILVKQEDQRWMRAWLSSHYLIIFLCLVTFAVALGYRQSSQIKAVRELYEDAVTFLFVVSIGNVVYSIIAIILTKIHSKRVSGKQTV